MTSSEISERTKVPVGFVLTMGSILLAVGAALVGGIYSVKTDMQLFRVEMAGKMEAVNLRLEAQTSDRYTKTAASEDALRNAIANPGRKFSDPRNPGQYISVDMVMRDQASTGGVAR